MKHRNRLTRINLLSLSCLLSLIFNYSAYANNDDWKGEWKLNNKNSYMSFTIKDTDKTELEFSYDEGIGINGRTFSGLVKPSTDTLAFVDYLDRGTKSCQLKLQLLGQGEILVVSNCELDSNDDVPKDGYKFVPHSQKLYYKAGFNCEKASTKIEVEICTSKILALSDRKLGAIYKLLRKQLSAKNKKRLRAEQRKWLKQRNVSCSKHNKTDIGFCLREHYGQRLVAMNILHDYKIWHSGKPTYVMFQIVHDVIKQRKKHSSFDFMERGLALWLGGVLKRRLTDTGSFEIQDKKFDQMRYILAGPYSSNPNEGFDPRAYGDKIFIEFSATTGIWVGLVADVNRLIYIPKNKKLSQASEKFKLWMKDFDEPKIIKAF